MKSTGVPTIDAILSGGLPDGLVDVYGEAGSGRSAFGACLLKQAAYEGRAALLVSTTPLEKDRLLSLGVPKDTLVATVDSWFSLGNTFGRVLEEVPNFLLVVDTASALEDVLNRDRALQDLDMNLLSEERGECLVRMANAAKKYDGTVVLINEARARLGSRSIRSALSSSARHDGLLSAKLKFQVVETKTAYGALAFKKVRVSVERSRFSPPGREAVVHLFANAGIDKWIEYLKQQVLDGRLTPRGGSYWMTGSGDFIGPGLARAAEQLREKYEEGNSCGEQGR